MLLFRSDKKSDVMATNRLIMGKKRNEFFLPQLGYLDFLQKYLLRYPLRFIKLLSKALNLIGCQGDKKGSFSKK